MKTLAHLMKLALIAALIFGCWKLYTATEEAKLASGHPKSPASASSDFPALLDPSAKLSATELAILSAKFNEADRAYAKRDVCLRARVVNPETPRRVFAPVSAIPGLETITTELRPNYDQTTTRPDASTSNSARTSPELRPNYDTNTTTASRAEDSLAAIYVRRSILEDELGKRETIATAFVITPGGRWTYYDPKSAPALTPVIQCALSPVSIVP